MLGKTLDSDEQVLIAEDDPNDAFFIQRAFLRAGITRKPHVCKNGQEAIDYFEGVGHYSDRTRHPFPRWILTDLKMPGTDGFEVLAWLRNHPDLQIIPTIVLSSSSDPGDVKRAYCLGANAYFCKPTGLDGLDEIIGGLVQFWLKCERCTDLERLPDCKRLVEETLTRLHR